eukprot:g13014.t1
MPLWDKVNFAQKAQREVRKAVLDQIPQFLFATQNGSTLPNNFSPYRDWLEWLEDVQRCMPIQHVMVDLEKKCAYDWESHNRGGRHQEDHSLSQLVNLWYALVARLDPWPEQPNKKFAWKAYFKVLNEHDTEDITDEAESENTDKIVKCYRSLAAAMLPSAHADPMMCFRTRGGVFDNRDSGPMTSALTMSYVRADTVVQQRFARIGVTLRLGRKGKVQISAEHPDVDDDAASDSDMSLAGIVPSMRLRLRRIEPEPEDARLTYWTLIDQLCRFPEKSEAVKCSLADMGNRLEPQARKRKTTIIHRHGHIGALLRMTENQFDYNLWKTRAEGLLQYIELFELDINFQHRQTEQGANGGSGNGQPEARTIMTHLRNDPALVIALMKHGAKPPPAAADAQDLPLAEIANDWQSIHLSVNSSALATLSVVALHFLETHGVEMPTVLSSTNTQSGESKSSSSLSSADCRKQAVDSIAGVVEVLGDRIRQLSDENFTSLRKAEEHVKALSDDEIAISLSKQLSRVVSGRFDAHPHPSKNGPKLLFLVRNFICLKYKGEEDADFLVLKALCQAGNQYGPNKQTCDPLPILLNTLTGRVTDADIENARLGLRKRGLNGAAEVDPTLLQNFLELLQDGAKAHNIVENGQKRLAPLDAKDQILLPMIYKKILDMESVEYATNRLRGLFAKQILEDAQEMLNLKFGNHDHDGTLDSVLEMPAGLLTILHNVYEVAEKLTKLFLAGELMQDAFAPFQADTAGGEGEPSTKRQKE